MKKSTIHLRIQFRRTFRYLYFPLLSFIVFIACDMTKELDIEILSIPPQLSVTAIFNGQDGIFDIRLKESYSLADLNKPVQYNKEIICDGEIRLFEDDELILSIPGPFDMSVKITEHGSGWKWGQNGYRWVSGGISSHVGSIYRLEVEVEGFPTAVSTSVMPAAPVVTANIDTSEQVIKKNVREIAAAGYWLSHFGTSWYDNYPDKYWPFSVMADVSGSENNYYALDLFKFETNYIQVWGIGGSDASILTENGMDNELFSSNLADLYLFPVLVTNNITNGVSRNFFAAVPEIPNTTESDDSYSEDNPNMEKIISQHQLILRVRNITPASYRYFRTLSMQYSENRFNEQPVTVDSNIENGYGCFAVYNTANISLLEWETCEYRDYLNN